MDPERIVAEGHGRVPDARALAAFGLAGEEPVPLPYGGIGAATGLATPS